MRHVVYKVHDIKGSVTPLRACLITDKKRKGLIFSAGPVWF